MTLPITQTHNTMPVVNETFIDDLQHFLAEEDAKRFADIFTSFVVSGGTHATTAGLVGTPDALLAYPGGFYTTETGAITYPDDKANIWVIAHKDTTSAVGGNFVRVAGTHYLIDSDSVSTPTLPADSLFLMQVTTASGAITVVVDLRVTTISSTFSVLAVDETDTDATKNKAVSNLLAKGWEDHLGATFEVDETDTDVTKDKHINNSLTKSYSDHLTNTSDPHSVTKTQVGLGNVTDDAQVKESTATTAGDLLVRNATVVARLGVGTSGQMLTVDSSDAQGFVWLDMFRGYIDGFKLSNGTDAVNDINIAAGFCRSDQNDDNIILTSTLVIAIDATAGEDSIDTGTVANDTWYYVHIYIKPSDRSTHGVFSLSATSPTLPDSAVSSRRVGAIRRDTALNRLMADRGRGQIVWLDPILDIDVADQSTTAVNRVLSVPAIDGTTAILNISANHASSTIVYFRDLSVNDEAPSTTVAPLNDLRLQVSAVDSVQGRYHIPVDGSSQISTRADSATTTVKIVTLGYIDHRGQE